MHLSRDANYSDNPITPLPTTEMRHTKQGYVDPLVTRPGVYYGEGPFDPPSSEDGDEDGPAVRHSEDEDAESVSLLSANKATPSSPGRAERGDSSPRRSAEAEKVRIISLRWC